MLEAAWRLAEQAGAATSVVTAAAASSIRARHAAAERAAVVAAGPRASMWLLSALPVAGPLAAVHRRHRPGKALRHGLPRVRRPSRACCSRRRAGGGRARWCGGPNDRAARMGAWRDAWRWQLPWRWRRSSSGRPLRLGRVVRVQDSGKRARVGASHPVGDRGGGLGRADPGRRSAAQRCRVPGGARGGGPDRRRVPLAATSPSWLRRTGGGSRRRSRGRASGRGGRPRRSPGTRPTPQGRRRQDCSRLQPCGCRRRRAVGWKQRCSEPECCSCCRSEGVSSRGSWRRPWCRWSCSCSAVSCPERCAGRWAGRAQGAPTGVVVHSLDMHGFARRSASRRVADTGRETRARGCRRRSPWRRRGDEGSIGWRSGRELWGRRG